MHISLRHFRGKEREALVLTFHSFPVQYLCFHAYFYNLLFIFFVCAMSIYITYNLECVQRMDSF